MFSDWPLADPVFALQWQVHITVAALFAVLGVWWSESRLPWYLPPTVLLVLLWLFVPLEAPDPAAVLLVTTPVVAAICSGIRWVALRFSRPAEAVTEQVPVPSRSLWRFRLSDSLWLTFLVGLGCALVAQLWRMPWPESRAVPSVVGVYWPDIAINVVCLVAITAAIYTVLTLRGWRKRALAIVLTLVAVMATVAIHSWLVRLELLLLADWSLIQDPLLGLGVIQREWWPILHVLLRTFLMFAFLVLLGMVLLGLGLPPQWKRTRWVGRVAAGLLLVVPLFELAQVYREMNVLPDWPVETFPARNRRDELTAIIKRHADVNPQEWSVDDLHKSGGAKGQAAAQQVARLFAELEDLLQTDEITLFDSRIDQPTPTGMPFENIMKVRGVGRSLQAQAKSDWAAGRRESALRHDVICLRIGAALQRRSTSIEALIGLALEGSATHHLASIRQDLTPEEGQRINRELQNIAVARESQELLLARNRVYDARMPGWRSRLSDAARRVRNAPSSMDHFWPDVCGRRDATLALLQTDLALRSYREQHGNWPQALSQLVPEFLPQVPVDPYSPADPLRYRSDEDGFVLYSVGPDGNDDAGKFGKFADVLLGRREGFDFDLDAILRNY